LLVAVQYEQHSLHLGQECNSSNQSGDAMTTDTSPAGLLSTYIASNAFNNQSEASTGQVVPQDKGNFDACACLLERVDFKWLMTGQGWWIDPHRFESDAAYAVEVLRFALASESLALRACARFPADATLRADSTLTGSPSLKRCS
jgi:hypothetical protein